MLAGFSIPSRGCCLYRRAVPCRPRHSAPFPRKVTDPHMREQDTDTYCMFPLQGVIHPLEKYMQPVGRGFLFGLSSRLKTCNKPQSPYRAAPFGSLRKACLKFPKTPTRRTPVFALPPPPPPERTEGGSGPPRTSSIEGHRNQNRRPKKEKKKTLFPRLRTNVYLGRGHLFGIHSQKKK